MGSTMVGIKIEEDEWLVIKQQIHASPLINESLELEEMGNQMQNDLGELIRRIETFIKEQKRIDDDSGERWKKS